MLQRLRQQEHGPGRSGPATDAIFCHRAYELKNAETARKEAQSRLRRRGAA